MRFTTSAFLILLYSSLVAAHVQLLFPVSRIDDSGLTTGETPCGSPRPANAKVTTIEAGSPTEVKWQVVIPHPGGFVLELLDEGEKLVKQLWDGTGNDNKRSSVTVELPANTACHKCTLRLTQKANGYGFDYVSCGDVEVYIRNNLPKQFDLSLPLRP